jgi:hypothetical protein
VYLLLLKNSKNRSGNQTNSVFTTRFAKSSLSLDGLMTKTEGGRRHWVHFFDYHFLSVARAGSG